MILRHLVYLDALAREKHFRHAAEVCHVTQPTLSAALKELEAELGVTLVKRGRRYQGLTQEGEAVLLHARRILAEGEQLRTTITELTGGIGGRLRLGAVPTALPMVGQITGPFCARFPNVQLTVLSLTSVEIAQRIAALDLDVGLTYLDNEPLDGVLAKPVYTESYVLLASDEGPFAGRRSLTWDEASRQKLCLLTPDMQNRRIIDGVFRSIGAKPRPAMETNSIFNLCVHAGVEGLCAIVPQHLLDFFVMPRGVMALPLVAPEVHHTIGLIVADRHAPRPLAQALMTISDRIGPGSTRANME